MKLFTLLSFLFFGVFSLDAQTKPATDNDIAKFLKFTNDNYDMGKITNGKSVEYNLDVQNISNSILYVTTEDFIIKDIRTDKPISESENKKIFPPSSTGHYIDFLRSTNKNIESLQFTIKHIIELFNYLGR